MMNGDTMMDGDPMSDGKNIKINEYANQFIIRCGCFESN